VKQQDCRKDKNRSSDTVGLFHMAAGCCFHDILPLLAHVAHNYWLNATVAYLRDLCADGRIF
jgi:hypothetical protein